MQKQQLSQITLDSLKRHLKTPILQILSVNQFRNTSYSDVVTAFGNMTLILEKSLNQSSTFYEGRKQFLFSPSFLDLFHLIYEQTIYTDQQSTFCMSLTERVHITEVKDHLQELQAKPLILSAMQITMKTDYSFEQSQFSMESILMSEKSKNRYFDFTKLEIKRQDYCQQKCVQTFTRKMQTLMMKQKKYKEQQKQEQDSLDEVIIVKDKVYRPSASQIVKAKSWFQLVVWFNLVPKMNVQLIKPQHPQLKPKETPLWKLSGNPTLSYNNVIYDKFEFIEGQCVNALEEISVQEMRIKFFRNNILYVVHRTNHTIVKKYQQVNAQGLCVRQNHINGNQKNDSSFQSDLNSYEQQTKNLNYNENKDKKRLKRHFNLPNLPKVPHQLPTDTIVIEQNVTKLECVNFLITYFGYVTPTLSTLEFFPSKNSLRLHLSTKANPKIIINLIFHPSYTLKDEEISIVLERSLINRCQLLLNNMSITDCLLFFLANFESMSKITKIDISGCEKLTQNGVNALLMSPYTQNLEEINISGLPLSQSAIVAISSKFTKLNKLQMNSCLQNLQSIRIPNLKLNTLEALNMNVQLNFADSIMVLKINCQVQLDNLRHLKNMVLTELRIRLVENRKSMVNNFLGNFYGKQSNPAKVFAEGPCRKTLKVLDLSYSSVKIKTLKPIFNMDVLQTLILDNYDRMGNEFQHVSPRLLNLSISRTPITIQQLAQLIHRTPHFVWLNISKTEIRKQEILQYLFSQKKYVNTLEISEDQYTNKLLDKQKSLVECIKVHINRLLLQDNQYVFNHMLYKASQSKKTLYLLNPQEPALLAKVKAYLANATAHPPRNIHINDKVYYQIKDSKSSAVETEQFIDCDGFKIKAWRNNQPIDSLTYYFVKAIREYSHHLVGVYLYKNKVLGPQAIQMMKLYGENRVAWLDFRGSPFTFAQVSSLLFQFPFLEKVNQGSYQINLDSQNFVIESQRSLKFFMKINNVSSLKLILGDIKQSEILYSVLYHLIDHHSQTLYELNISLKRAKISPQAITFWSRIFDLKRLRSLTVSIEHRQQWRDIRIFDHLNKMNLHNLKLHIPSAALPHLQMRDIRSLYLCVSNELITDSSLGKVFKSLPNLKQLSVIADCCVNVANLHKFSSISKMSKLQLLSISLEYCHLKEPNLFQFIQSIRDLKQLQTCQFNLSYTTQNWNQLLKSVEIVKDHLPNTYIKIIAVKQILIDSSQTSTDFVFNREELELKGLQFVL